MKLLPAFLLGSILFSQLHLNVISQTVDVNEMKKKEEERRKKMPPSKIIITDTNVDKLNLTNKKFSLSISEKNPDEQETSRPITGQGESQADKQNQPNPEGDPEKTPEYWKNQKTENEAKIKQLEDALNMDQLALNKLWSDFYVTSSPIIQNDLRNQINAVTKQIETNKVNLRTAQKEIIDFYRRVRQAGIPPGWLR